MNGLALRPGGFWIRGTARAFDWIVQTLVAIILGMFLSVVAEVVSGRTGRPNGFARYIADENWVGNVISVLSALAYYAVFEGLAGTTIGKRILGLQIVSVEPSLGPTRFLQGCKRTLAFLFDALFCGLVGWASMSETEQRRRIGDHWAGTRVVYRKSLPAELRPPGMRVVGAMALAIATLAVLQLAGYVFGYLWFLRGQ